MEEDIKILEDMITWDCTLPNKRQTEALENLLTRYKQLEEKKERIIIEKAEALQEVRKYKAKVKDSIPKSKVKEEIEELRAIMLDIQTKYKGTYALLDEWRNAKAQENILIELLEEE